MKKRIMLALIILFSIVNTSIIYSQVEELKYESDIYLYDKDSRVLYNKTNRAKDYLKGEKVCEFVSIKENILTDNFVKELFVYQEIIECGLNDKNIVLTLYTNNEGEIAEIGIILPKNVNTREIPLAIINKFEKGLIGKKLTLSGACNNIPYYQFFQVVKLKNLF